MSFEKGIPVYFSEGLTQANGGLLFYLQYFNMSLEVTLLK